MSGPGSETSDGRSMQSRTGRNKQSESWLPSKRTSCGLFHSCRTHAHDASAILPTRHFRSWSPVTPCLAGATGQLANALFTRNVGYNSKGERLVAGVVPLSPDLNFVLLIQSTRRKGWVLPKGGWETDESCQEAATREAWEEAGITIQIDYDLGTIDEKRPPKSSKDRSRYSFFQATVLSEVEDWPERHKRERQWFTYTQALDALATRPELQEALQRSTINQL